MQLLQSIIASITAFITALFGFRGTGPVAPHPTDQPLTYAPASPATYPTNTYENSQYKYSFKYPSASNLNSESSDAVTIDANTLHVNSFNAPPLTLSSLLSSDLFCPIGEQQSNATCKNTAVRPLTNPEGTIGYLVRRTKIIDGETYQDTVYVFQNPKQTGDGLVLGVESPSSDNLRVLDDVAASFSFEK